ncbi:protein mono-ADP-ribosyltransferase PARP4 [Xenopus tropicalis]|uniref:Poly [ADP-ribose] polymerase n=1 Tax=Xenopus tropicalis TaxID=8364 RepID=A0A8J1J8Z1_XENTR|nr:protein mono-ADP-ribosyltransferase PARP4 [Xenopus tropicalis]XP_031753136.1 protein mono-ADP-ribosyltransferase PARP4 [Xenopus tropicalis]|eukprot:XP_017947226.1 PREDICTED: poly [ADP-ribose] polymerase 4-like [Xenopus tropicalis]
MGVFEDCVFFLKVNNLFIKEKGTLQSSITSNGGVISFILNQKCTHVLVDSIDSLSDSQLKTVQKHQILIVGADYVRKCLEKQSLIKDYQYPNDVPPSEKQAQRLQDHENTWYPITGTRENKNELQHRDYSDDDENIITEPPKTKVLKYCFLQKGPQVAVFELLCFPDPSSFPFRISTIICQSKGPESDCCFQFEDNSELACQKYDQCIEDLKKDGYKILKTIPKDIVRFTSESLQMALLRDNIILPRISLDVGYFVESVWTEALTHLDQILSCPVNNISLSDVSKAEGVLLYVRKLLGTGTEPGAIRKAMAEFYRLIPHKEPIQANTNMKLLSIKQELCQLIGDIVNACEINSGELNPSSFAKYRALQCRIEHIDPESEEFLQVSQQVLEKQRSEEMINIKNIFRISKSSEAVEFERNLGNVKPLLHASSPHSFVGILYRGLLLPKSVEDDLDLPRTDTGHLGRGIYFSDSISARVKYSEPAVTNGARLILVCDVALGNCKDVYKRNFSLTAAPSGFHSVHGVREIPGAKSDFEEDEFVVYKKDQVTMRYVVQFCTDKDTVNMEPNKLPLQLENTEEDNEREQVQSDDDGEHNDDDDSEHDDDDGELLQSDDDGQKVQSDDNGDGVQSDDESESEPPMKNIIHGLQSIDGQQIPVDNVHVKGRIIDIAAEVTLFQTYVSHSTEPIEAKYVFPLDRRDATVCGFEAFINGRHIIGEVKEKEQAHEEYRAAISEGRGAYLMDQDAADVFSLSLGILPPKATVIIKITYLNVLSRNYDSLPLQFIIPPTVASWVKYDGEDIYLPEGCFSLEMSIEMPCKIQSIHSKTHLIKLKKTDCKAVITTEKDSDMLYDGFFLDITLEEPFFPRLWVEKHPDEDSEACMLVYHSSLEDTFDKWNVTICLDCSNSMESCFETAKYIALTAIEKLFVYHKLNVVLFGTNYLELYAYTKSHHYEEIEEVQRFISLAKPNMGGTELWKPLQAISLLPPSSGMHKILLISDGHIQNESLVFKILNKNAGKMSIYSCSVGATANKHLLGSLSRQSRGTCEYFEDASVLEKKVTLQTERIWSPSCWNMSVKWQQASQNCPKPIQAPTHIPPLFPYKHLLVCGFVSDCTQALFKDQELDTVVSATELQKSTGTMLHRMTARAIIRDYEDGMLHIKGHEHEMKKHQLKPFIIGLSKKYSLVSEFTRFVAEGKQEEQGKQENWVQNVHEMISAIDVDILPHMDWSPKKQKTPWHRSIRYKHIMQKCSNWTPREERHEKDSSDQSTMDGEEGSDPVTPLSSLSALQCEEGYWQLNESLGSLINIDVSYLCNEFLLKNGIQSLGSKGREEVPKLIATLLVLQVIRTNNLQGIKCKSLVSLDEPSGTSQFHQATERAMEWVRKRDRQYPGICYRLGLGKDWESATRKLLSIDPVDPSSDLYPAVSRDRSNS